MDILKYNHQRDIAAGSTGAGIHRDDIAFDINGIPARIFGSQGQQRTAALSVKLAEIEIMRESTGTAPVLLLDDVMSELDGSRQAYLLEQIGKIQTVITCTGLEDILTGKSMTDCNIMRMENGEIFR
jgi:DNA replication and repair protein RecF